MTHHPITANCSAIGGSSYDLLAAQLRELLRDEAELLANAANTAALLYHGLADVNWVGFYWLKHEQLVLGPFQGKPACTRIAIGRGVCGTAAQRRTTIIVPDVAQFAGHIACDSASRSELVVPLAVGERLIGVLDVDSGRLDRFADADREGLERLAKIFLEVACHAPPDVLRFLD